MAAEAAAEAEAAEAAAGGSQQQEQRADGAAAQRNPNQPDTVSPPSLDDASCGTAAAAVPAEPASKAGADSNSSGGAPLALRRGRWR